MSLQSRTTVSSGLAGSKLAQRVARGRTKRRAEGALEAFDRRGVSKQIIQALNRKQLEKSRRKRAAEGNQRVLDVRRAGAPNPILRVERDPGRVQKIKDKRKRRIGESIPPLAVPRAPIDIDAPISGAKNVSIWSDIVGGIGQGLSKGLSQGITAKLAPQQKIIGPAVGAAARTLPAIGRVLTGRVATGIGIGAAGATLLGGGGGGAACPSGFHFAKDGSGRCVRNRRMNFGNARAARRSVRRLKGARKLLRDIEKMMPTKTTRRRAPAGHSQHLHHTGG